MTEEKQIRCAIYTRKSTTEGSDQDFTSLDAQRESAESYIDSQKHQGWIVLSQKYDDFGYTGANIDRPALKQLMEDIKNKQVDCVVVYKVDRLSRSLLDFANLLNLFDEQGVTFVSITQHFNTQSSMGRLTLNILLSFAQFEREIISERTSDKMGAARKKGKFVGGRPALGYNLDTENHCLVVNPKEATIIKEIFNLYLQKKSILQVATILNEHGYRSKKYIRKGNLTGGNLFNITSTNHILRNVIYIGKVNYRGTIYPGEHQPIIDEEIFNKAQEILSSRRPVIRLRKTKYRSILSNIFRCKTCNRAMIYSYAKKRNYRYKYYVCTNAIKRGHESCPTRMLNAQRTEEMILDLIRDISSFPELDPKTWIMIPSDKRIEIFHNLVERIEYDGKDRKLYIKLINEEKLHTFDINLRVQDEKNQDKKPDIKDEPKIRQQLILAHQVQQMLDSGKLENLDKVSEWTNISRQRINQIMNLLFLAPAIQEEILLSDPEKLCAISEVKLRPIIRNSSWQKQIAVWKKLLQ